MVHGWDCPLVDVCPPSTLGTTWTACRFAVLASTLPDLPAPAIAVASLRSSLPCTLTSSGAQIMLMIEPAIPQAVAFAHHHSSAILQQRHSFSPDTHSRCRARHLQAIPLPLGMHPCYGATDSMALVCWTTCCILRWQTWPDTVPGYETLHIDVAARLPVLEQLIRCRIRVCTPSAEQDLQQSLAAMA